MITKTVERALRKHMSSVPGGDIDFDPVEYQEINQIGEMVTYNVRAGKDIKDAWYVAFDVAYLNLSNKFICVYGLLDDTNHYTYVSDNGSDQ